MSTSHPRRFAQMCGVFFCTIIIVLMYADSDRQVSLLTCCFVLLSCSALLQPSDWASGFAAVVCLLQSVFDLCMGCARFASARLAPVSEVGFYFLRAVSGC